MPRVVDAFVYAIGNAKIGVYKIGYSKNVKQRLSVLRKYSPVELNVVMECFVKNAEAAEKSLHKIFRRKRSHGEWYFLNLCEVSNLESLIPKRFKPRLPACSQAQKDLDQFLGAI